MIHPTVKVGQYVVIHPSASIGAHSVIWDHCRILADVVIGENVSIGGGTEIGRGSVIGNHTRISTQCFLPSNSVVGERVFLAPQVCATDDMHPRAGNSAYDAMPPTFEDGCAVGAQSVIRPGITIGLGAMVGCGAIVTQDIAPHEHVRGEPARVKPYSRIQTETSYDIYSADVRERMGK